MYMKNIKKILKLYLNIKFFFSNFIIKKKTTTDTVTKNQVKMDLLKMMAQPTELKKTKYFLKYYFQKV